MTSAIKLIKGEKVNMPTKYGIFHFIPFKEINSGAEHMVLLKAKHNTNNLPLIRIHSACATGDLFGSLRCDCGDQLIKAIQLIEQNQFGAIVYLQQEGRGIGLMNKINAYKLQELGMDTVDANLHLGFDPDERNYAVGAEILRLMNFNTIQLLTNNPEKVNDLIANGIKVSQRIPIVIKPNKYNEWYLRIKKYRMGHFLNKQEAS